MTSLETRMGVWEIQRKWSWEEKKERMKIQSNYYINIFWISLRNQNRGWKSRSQMRENKKRRKR